MHEESRSQAQKLRRFGQLAGLGYVAAIAAAAAAAAVGPEGLDAGRLALLAAGVLTAALCLMIDWERFGWVGLHAIALVGTLQVAIAVEFFDHFATAYYLLVAIYAAGVFERRSQVIPHLVVVSLVVVASALYHPDSAREHARFAAFMVPMVWLAAGMILYLREGLTASVRDYRRLAAEAANLGERIQRANRRVAPQARRPAGQGR